MQQLLRPPGQRVAKRNARKEEQIKCVLAPRPKPHRAAGINHQACIVPRRARRPSTENAQASSHVDPRTATLHACAKLRPKRPFLLDRARPVFFSGKTEKKMGGASPLDKPPCGSRHPPWPPRRRPIPPPPAAGTSAPPSPPPGGPPLPPPPAGKIFLNSQILHRYPLYKWNALRYDSSVSTRRI